jgi:hypothetical protein
MLPEMPWEKNHPPLMDAQLAANLPKYPFDPDGSTKASQQRRWEHKIVGTILKHFGLVAEATEMAKMVREKTGLACLTFDVFYHHYPSFPLWLAARKIPYVHETTMSDFIKGFTKTKMYRAFTDCESEIPDWRDEDRSGLVFEWLHVWPLAIIHNCYRGLKDQETVVFHHFPVTEQLVSVQSFSSFLNALAWTPASSPRVVGA